MAIQTKAKPTKQLAPDSISKVIRVQPTAATTVEQPEPEPEPSYEERVAATEAKFGIAEKVDDSLNYGTVEDYKIDLLDQYDEHYLRKVVKYQHDQIQDLNEQSIINIGPEHGKIPDQSEQVEQLQQQIEKLTKENKLLHDTNRMLLDKLDTIKISKATAA